MMSIKLTPQQFKYLMENCKFLNSISAICNNENSVKISVDINLAENIREWALNELEIKGFDENYELNYHGKIIEALVDLFHV